MRTEHGRRKTEGPTQAPQGRGHPSEEGKPTPACVHPAREGTTEAGVQGLDDSVQGLEGRGGSRAFLKFFPSDWTGDHELAMCSLEERGLLVELMCLCFPSGRSEFCQKRCQICSKRCNISRTSRFMALARRLQKHGRIRLYEVDGVPWVEVPRMVRDVERAEAFRKLADQRWGRNAPRNAPRNAGRNAQRMPPDTRVKEEMLTRDVLTRETGRGKEGTEGETGRGPGMGMGSGLDREGPEGVERRAAAGSADSWEGLGRLVERVRGLDALWGRLEPSAVAGALKCAGRMPVAVSAVDRLEEYCREAPQAATLRNLRELASAEARREKVTHD